MRRLLSKLVYETHLYFDVGNDDCILVIIKNANNKERRFCLEDIFTKSVREGMISDMGLFHADLSMIVDALDYRSLTSIIHPLSKYHLHIITRNKTPSWQRVLFENVANENMFDRLSIASHESICRGRDLLNPMRIYQSEVYIADKLLRFSPDKLAKAAKEFLENKYSVDINQVEVQKLLSKYFTQDHTSIGKRIIKYDVITKNVGSLSASYEEITESVRPVMKQFVEEADSCGYILPQKLQWVDIMLETRRYQAFDKNCQNNFRKINVDSFYYLDTLMESGSK